MTDLGALRIQNHERNLNVARSRAFVIHHQRDVEAKILDYIEELSETPAGSSPSKHEAEQLLAALALFRPRDFDDLTTEREAQTLCSHPLCSKAPPSAGASKRGLQKRLFDPSGDAEKWCSDLCMQKSLWLRQQLPPEPAWERQHRPIVKLHPHDRGLLAGETDQLERNMSAMKLGDATDLAQERGDSAVSWKPGHVMTESLVEKASVSKPKPPVLLTANDLSADIDGYVPRQLDNMGSRPAHAHAELSRPALQQQSEIDEEQSWHDMLEQMKIGDQTSVE